MWTIIVPLSKAGLWPRPMDTPSLATGLFDQGWRLAMTVALWNVAAFLLPPFLAAYSEV
jgi:hypothetical protein